MQVNKTIATDASVVSFLADIDEQKRQDSQDLITLMQHVSGESPVMWGTSIIGFGSYHYTYESGREGDAPIISFSPRKANLTLYIYQGFDELGELLDKLGPHTTSVGCLYIKRLNDIDLSVLNKILTQTVEMATTSQPAGEMSSTMTVDEYIDSFDTPQHNHLTTIRNTVKTVVPDATEKISYKIAAFQLNGKMLLYYGGFKDHVSMYPVPLELEKELSGYIKGRGTLWFPLDTPLPVELIEKVALAHANNRRYGSSKY